MYARRAMVYTAPVGGPIVGKPTVPFSPNISHPYYPNQNACFLTNLISGQTAYTQDSIAGRNPLVFVGGSAGNHAQGEGYAITDANNQGTEIDTTNLGFESWCYLVEFSIQSVNVSNNSIFISTNRNYLESVYAGRSACLEGAAWMVNLVCIPSLNDGAVHRVALMAHRTSASQIGYIYADGIEAWQGTANRWLNGRPIYFGKNNYTQSTEVTLHGAWVWSSPFDGPIPITEQGLTDLTTDPWPYLVTLD